MGKIIAKEFVTSKSVALCSPPAQDRIDRYWLATDDWGVLELDFVGLKGELWRYRPDVTEKKIESDLSEYRQWGMLFVWVFEGKTFGYWAKWEEWPNWPKSRRSKKKTPEPPMADVANYVQDKDKEVFETFLKRFGSNMLQASTAQVQCTQKKVVPSFHCSSILPSTVLPSSIQALIPPFVELFNSTRESLKEVKEFKGKRTKLISLRLKEHPDLEWWKVVFEKAAKASINYSDWRPEFDWLIKNDTNALKVYEGQYDQKEKPNARRSELSKYPERTPLN